MKLNIVRLNLWPAGDTSKGFAVLAVLSLLAISVSVAGSSGSPNGLSGRFLLSEQQNSERSSSTPQLADTHDTKFIAGWTIHIHHRLLKELPDQTQVALALMKQQLMRLSKALPARSVKRLQQVTIWVNPKYPGERARCEYHPGRGWLAEHGRDVRMVRCVEVSNVEIFEAENRRMPDLMLHELAHAWHHQVLGWDYEPIGQAYQLAKKSGTYDSVARWTGRKTVTDTAYAMTNAKEYFAEVTEAYFGRNDFFPFDRTELQKHDPDVVPVLMKCWDPARIDDDR